MVQPLKLDEFCWPPNGKGSTGPITYGDDGSINVGDDYGGDGLGVTVEGDEVNYTVQNFNDSIIQNFEVVRNTVNTALEFYNDNSTTFGPVTSWTDYDFSTTNQITNMGDINLENNFTTEQDLRDFSTHTDNSKGPTTNNYSYPQAADSILIGLTKSIISPATNTSSRFTPGTGIVSILYQRRDIDTRAAQAVLNFQRALRICRGREQSLNNAGSAASTRCWNAANALNPFGTSGAAETHYEEPRGGTGNIDPNMGFLNNEAQNIAQQGGSPLAAGIANDPEVIAQQIIQPVFNISPCPIGPNITVVLGRESNDRYWIIAEACLVCP